MFNKEKLVVSADDIPRQQLKEENNNIAKSISADELSPMPNEPWKEDSKLMLNGEYLRFKNVPIFTGKYKLKSSIGQGSFGFVIKAERFRDGKDVAIKFIYRQNINSANWLFDSELGMIPAEVYYLKSLRHGGIVQFLDYFDDGRYVYLITEFHGTSWSPGNNPELNYKRNPGIKTAEGANFGAPCDLFECIEAHKNLPETTIHFIFKQLLEIVSYLSSKEIVHRDLKDENVVVDADYRIKIVDFGCAARIPWIGYGVGREEGWFEKFNGTLEFAPPEVIKGQKYRGSEAEIWTLGVLLYTMAFRQAPFQDAQSILYGQLEFPFEEDRPANLLTAFPGNKPDRMTATEQTTPQVSNDEFELIKHEHDSIVQNNLIVAFCLDGTVYAMDAENGAILWGTSGSFTDGPLLKRRNRNRMREFDKIEYLIEPLGDGAIFQVESGGTGAKGEVKRLPFTLKSLVHMSPVHWQESEEKALYLIAKRESSIFVLNLVSGSVKRRQFKESESSDEEMAMEPMETASLLVGRTDYHVQGFDESNLEVQWEITMTQFKSLHVGSADNDTNSNDFYTTFNGHLVSKQAEGPWIAKLESPVLQIFRPMRTAKGFVTLQEIELKGSASGAVAAKRHVLFDQNKATFYFDDLVNVGVMNLEGNGTMLFVLPQSHYPLLRDRKKPMIGEEKGQQVGLILSRHEFLSVQRVSRQHLPPTVKLLNYESHSVHYNKLVIGVVSVILGFMGVLWLMKKYHKKSRAAKGGVLEMSEEVLGYGSHGTVVFKGKFGGRPVAIKRLLSDFYSLADREISLLQEHDTHPNVIRYFYREQQERFILVALELAQCSLHEFIDPTGKESSSSTNEDFELKTKLLTEDYENIKQNNVDKVELLRQVMSGLSFLHEKGLIHRDLKPQNILLQLNRDDLRVLISDFGLSRKLVEMESSFHATAKASGTLGWRAPEIIFNEEAVRYQNEISDFDSLTGPVKIGKSVDIFAAGLIFYFVLSGGKHAFGSRMMRESNISIGKLEIDSKILTVEADNLIREMLRKRAKDRPTAKQILIHPFFWDSERKLEFICAVSDVLEAEERNFKREQVEKAPPGFENVNNLPMRDAIDMAGTRVFKETNTWHKELDRVIFQDLTKHRYYMVNKLHDLLRAIRNKRNHFHETPLNVQEVLGTSPVEAWKYFEEKFPTILMECYTVIERFVKSDGIKSLEKYYI